MDNCLRPDQNLDFHFLTTNAARHCDNKILQVCWWNWGERIYLWREISVEIQIGDLYRSVDSANSGFEQNNALYSQNLHTNFMNATAVSTDPVRTYLHEIAQIPLLTHEQEIAYSKKVQEWSALIEIKNMLAAELSREPNLTEWSTAANCSLLRLQKQITAGEKAKRQMIEANLRLVVSVAKKYTNRNVDFLDLIQEGNIGMQRGVEKFDPSQGYRFSTYAYFWIRQAITRAIAEKSRSIRLPIHINEKLYKIKKVQRQLLQSLGRSATVSELASELELTTKGIRDCLAWAHQPLSLNIQLGENQDVELGDLLECPGISPEAYATHASLQVELEKMISLLTYQQQQVLTLHFGLKNTKPLTVVQIATLLNISNDRVYQIEQEAIAKLRRRKNSINEYLA
jgi:RNA polymerase nonessential primary-like sigma factor